MKMETMTITPAEIKRFDLPAKAIGHWAIVDETNDYKVLHKLKGDRSLASDRPNNIFKLMKSHMIFKKKPNDEKLLTAKSSDGKNVVIARTNTVNLCDDDEPKVEPSSQAKPNIKIDDGEVPAKKVEDNPETKTETSDSSIGTRKQRWIDQLLKKFEEDPFLSKLLDDLESVKAKIIEDTDPDKGKKYSSIESALKVWNIRIRKGEVQ